MDFESELNYAYRSLISDQAQRILSKIVGSFIRHAQSLKRNSGYMLSPEDSPLENLWDEICVDAKSGTVDTTAYISYIEQYVKNVVMPLMPQTEKAILFISSEHFDTWLEDEEQAFCDTQNAYKGIEFKAFDIDLLMEYICSSIISTAMDYLNARIEDYLL